MFLEKQQFLDSNKRCSKYNVRNPYQLTLPFLSKTLSNSISLSLYRNKNQIYIYFLFVERIMYIRKLFKNLSVGLPKKIV